MHPTDTRVGEFKLDRIRSKLRANELRVLELAEGDPHAVEHAVEHPPELVLSGRLLRYAALVALDRWRGRDLGISEIQEEIETMGFQVAGPHPAKRLADALGHEVCRGRAI